MGASQKQHPLLSLCHKRGSAYVYQGQHQPLPTDLERKSCSRAILHSMLAPSNCWARSQAYHFCAWMCMNLDATTIHAMPFLKTTPRPPRHNQCNLAVMAAPSSACLSHYTIQHVHSKCRRHKLNPSLRHAFMPLRPCRGRCVLFLLVYDTCTHDTCPQACTPPCLA